MRRLARMLAALCALTLSWSACAEGRLCVSTGGISALLDESGAEIISPGIYDEIFTVVPDLLFAVGEDANGHMEYRLCGADGAVRTEETFSMLDESHGVILFRQNGGYGAMSPEGEILIPAQYTQLVTNGEGGFLALSTDHYDDEADEIIFVNALGEAIHTGVRTASGLSAFSDGRMSFRSPDTERYGYVDVAGQVVVAASLTYAGEFSEGMARASEEGLYGVLTASGKWLIPPRYDYLQIGETAILTLQDDAVCIVWDSASCTERFRVEGSGIDASLAGDRLIVMDAQCVRLYGEDGAILMEVSADATLSPGAGGQLILSDGDWGTQCVSIVDESGSRMERRDQHLLALDGSRYAFMTMNVAAYNSSALNEIRYSCDYESIRYGMLDREGREILPAEYLEIRCIGENRYLTVAEDGLRVTDGEGNVLWSLIEEEDSAQEEQPVPQN